MALKQFQVLDPKTGVGGDYCKIMGVRAVYISNVDATRPETRKWKNIEFSIDVWKDEEARLAGKGPIKGLGWVSEIPAEMLAGFTILEDNEATLEMVYPLLRVYDPKLMGAIDC